MEDTGPLIPYASTSTGDHPSDRFLRRIVGWLAIVCGARTVLLNALYVALSNGWVAQPPSMAWGLGGWWRAAIMAGETVAMCALLLGGTMLLRRLAGAVALLRCAAVALATLSLLGQAGLLHFDPDYAGYWTEPATAAVEALVVLNGFWLPVVIVLLTLPPLARRMG